MAELINNSNFEEKVLKSPMPVLVDFYATWCGPCMMLSPILEELEEENRDRVTFCKVDIDQTPGLAVDYGVVSVPTLVLFKDGAPSAASVGLRPKEELQEFLG